MYSSFCLTATVTNHEFDGRTQINELILLSQSKYKVKLVGGQYHDFKAFSGLVFLLKLNLKLRWTNLLSRIGVAWDWCGCNSITGSGDTDRHRAVCLSACPHWTSKCFL